VLRVLIGSPFGTRMGGADENLWTLLMGRERAQIDPHVLLLADGPYRKEMEAEGIPTTVVEPGRFREPWKLAGAIARTTTLIREVQPDLCLSWLPRVQTVMAPAATLAGKRDRIVYFERELPRNWINRAAVALPCRWVVASSASILAVTQAMRPHRDGTTVWPGIRPTSHTAPRVLAELRQRVGLRGRPVVGIAGRLLGWKGQDKLIDAAALLRARGHDIDLLIVGSEAHGVEVGIETMLRARVAELGLEDRVFFTGHVDPAAPYIELMDVFVLASDGEPFGIVLVEAMSLGLPVVAVGKYGPAEIVEDGVSGVLTQTNSPAHLADVIEALLRDERLRRRLGAGAYERYRSTFRQERMLDDLNRTLHGLVAEIDGGRAA
jgi:glycosyltransferase involved in cell wall biosynthesis